MAAINGKYSLEEKREARAYFNKNNVPEHLEKLLNDMFKEKPDDIFGYMSEFFGNISKDPVISKIKSHEVLSSRGYPTVQLELYCTIKGLFKHVTSLLMPYDVCPEPILAKTPDLKAKSPDPGKQAKSQTTESQPSAAPSETDIKTKLDVDDLVDRIASTLAPELEGMDPIDQNGVDRILMSLVQDNSHISRPQSVAQDKDEQETEKTADDASGKFSTVSKKSVGKKASGMLDKKGTKESALQMPDMVEDFVNVDYAILGVSMVTLQAGATLKECPLYDHLRSFTNKKDEKTMTMPIPAMTLISSGKYAAGKQNLIKEIMILPIPGVSINKGLQQLTEIHHKMGMVLCQKTNPSARCVTEDGSYTPACDKPEILLDYVVEAINSCGYALGADVEIILNCAASDLYDKDKMKYEIITNTFKSLDDIINMYADFLERYPGIVGIVDGVRSQDREGWIKLNQKIGEKCFIIGSELYRCNAKILTNGITDKLSSAAVIAVDQANTVTELLEKILFVQDQDGLVFLSQAECRDQTSLEADLAVSCGVRFIKLGGPTRLENVTKYRRLAIIEQELQLNDRLEQQKPHVFPVVNIPEEETENQDAQDKQP